MSDERVEIASMVEEWARQHEAADGTLNATPDDVHVLAKEIREKA